MERLTAEQLLSVSALWRTTSRELVTRFNGGSMLPTIRPDQDVTVLCTDDVQSGDVIVVAVGSDVLVHRLVARGESWWLTQGDANRLPDTLIQDQRSIIGRVLRIEGKDIPRAATAMGSLATAAAVRLLRLHVGVGRTFIQLLLWTKRIVLWTYAVVRRPSPSSRTEAEGPRSEN